MGNDATRVKVGIAGAVALTTGAVVTKLGASARSPMRIAGGAVLAATGALAAFDAVQAAQGQQLVTARAAQSVVRMAGRVLPSGETALKVAEGAGYVALTAGAASVTLLHRKGLPRRTLVPGLILGGAGLAGAHFARRGRGQDGPVSEAAQAVDGVIDTALPRESARRNLAGNALRVAGAAVAIGGWLALNPHRPQGKLASMTVGAVSKSPADAKRILQLERAAVTLGGIYLSSLGGSLLRQPSVVTGTITEATNRPTVLDARASAARR